MKRQFIIGFISGSIIFGTIGALAATYTATNNPFPIKLNGNDVQIEGYNIEDSTYFKLRDIANIVGGFNVDFANNTIQLSKDGYVYNSDISSDDNHLNEFMKASWPTGYEPVTDYSAYNSYASENGMKDKKISVQGYVTNVLIKETSIYANLQSYQNPSEQWLIGLGSTDICNYEKLKNTFQDKYVSLGGSYLGYSDVENLPSILFEYAAIYDSGSYKLTDFIS